MLTAVSNSFLLLLAAFVLLNPASGAFVGLSQASLMDADPARHEHNMARWALAGSLGLVAGPLVLSLAVGLGAGWRSVFFALAFLAFLLLRLAWRFSFQTASSEDDQLSFAESARNAFISFSSERGAEMAIVASVFRPDARCVKRFSGAVLR